MKIHLIETPALNSSATAFVNQIDALLAKKPDAVGLTDVSGKNKALLRLAKKNEYTLVHPQLPATTQTGEWAGKFAGDAILVRGDHPVKKEGWTFGINGRPGTPAKGGHEPLGVTWVRAEIDSQLCWIGQIHFLSKGLPDAEDQDPARVKDNQSLLRKAQGVLKREGTGRKLGFLLNDSHLVSKSLGIDGVESVWGSRNAPKTDIVSSLSSHAAQFVSTNRVRKQTVPTTDSPVLSVWYEVALAPAEAPTPVPEEPSVAELAPELEIAQETEATVLNFPAKKAPAKKAAAKKQPKKISAAK